MAASVPHRPNKYFHVTASNGTVSNSPYTPLAITTASPSALVRVFDPRCRCRLVTFAALPTPSMIERAIILLTDQRFWGHASGPSSSGKTLPCSIHCWHGHAARRSALPRERFRPWALLRHANEHLECLLSEVFRKAGPVSRAAATKQGVRADLTTKYGITSVGRTALPTRR
jgi:hypothetical protein